MTSRNVIPITPSSGSIFLDLGFDSAEARVMQARADLMVQIKRVLAERHLTQRAAAEILKVKQSRVSDLVNGKAAKFSLDMLATFAQRLGERVCIDIA